MRSFLYTDTETSCLNEKHIVQIACLLATETEEISSFNVLIRPDGWEIDPKAEAIHNISKEKAEQFGVPIDAAMWMFDSLSEQADVVISHNFSFDSSVIHSEYTRLDRRWKPRSSFCTMLAMTPLCKIPSRYRGQFKWPKLSESHIWAFGENFENQHDAMSDVKACRRLHQYLLKNEYTK